MVGQCTSGYEAKIMGISASLTAFPASPGEFLSLPTPLYKWLGTLLDRTIIIVDDSFVGPGYALPSKGGRNAATLFVRMEAILLDPAYTGKTAAALLNHSDRGTFNNSNALFIHTGANAVVFY